MLSNSNLYIWHIFGWGNNIHSMSYKSGCFHVGGRCIASRCWQSSGRLWNVYGSFQSFRFVRLENCVNEIYVHEIKHVNSTYFCPWILWQPFLATKNSFGGKDKDNPNTDAAVGVWNIKTSCTRLWYNKVKWPIHFLTTIFSQKIIWCPFFKTGSTRSTVSRQEIKSDHYRDHCFDGHGS